MTARLELRSRGADMQLAQLADHCVHDQVFDVRLRSTELEAYAQPLG